MTSFWSVSFESHLGEGREGAGLGSEPALGVSVCEGLQPLTAFEEPWERLWWVSPGATPFQHPAWLLPWLRQYGRNPLTLAARRGDRLVGLMFLDLPPEGSEEVLLAGEDLGRDAGLIAEPGEERRVAEALLERALGILGERWMVLRRLPATSPLLEAAVRRGLAAAPDEPALVLELSAHPEALISRLPGAPNQAPFSGRIALASYLDFDELFSAFVELQRKESALGQASALSEEAAGFLRHASRRLLERGLLRLYLLSVDGRPAASLCILATKDQAFCLLGGSDPELAALRPGSVLLEHALSSAIADGVREVHFLNEREGGRVWGAEERQTWALPLGVRPEVAVPRPEQPAPGEGP